MEVGYTCVARVGCLVRKSGVCAILETIAPVQFSTRLTPGILDLRTCYCSPGIRGYAHFGNVELPADGVWNAFGRRGVLMALISSQLFFRCSGPGEEATVGWFHDGTYLGSGQVPITKPPKAIEYCVCCACFPNPTIAFKSRILLLVVGTEEYS